MLGGYYSTTLHGLSHLVLYCPCEVGINTYLWMRHGRLFAKIATIRPNPWVFPFYTNPGLSFVTSFGQWVNNKYDIGRLENHLHMRVYLLSLCLEPLCHHVNNPPASIGTRRDAWPNRHQCPRWHGVNHQAFECGHSKPSGKVIQKTIDTWAQQKSVKLA